MEFVTKFVPIAAVVVICMLCGMFFKWLFAEDKRKLAAIPWMLALIGGVFGIVAQMVMPEYAAIDWITAFAIGIVSGLAAGGAYQVIHQQQKLK